jgi:biopolymer transport protein ExbB
MTNTFNEIQKAAGGNVTGHAGAIGLALYATALGLVTAIPLVFAHVLFKAWIAQFEVKMKNAAQKLLVLVQAARPATGQPHLGIKPVGIDPAAISPRK